MQPAFLLAGNRARNGVAVVAFKNMFTSTTLWHKDFVTVKLSFYYTVSKKIGMVTNNSGLNSNYLLVSEKRRERERRERHRVRINRRVSEEDSSGKFTQHLRVVH